MINEIIVNLDFDEAQNLIIAEASSQTLWMNPAIKIFLGRVKAIKNGSRIEIKTDSHSLGNIYQQLSNRLNDNNCKVIESAAAKGSFEDVKNKELAFQLHSQKALDVWTRKVEPNELRVFEEVVGTIIKRELSDLQFLSALN